MITLTAQTLADACHMKPADAAPWVEPLNAAMARFGIDTRQRAGMFLANLSHESQRFTRPRENLNYTTAERLLAVFRGRIHPGEASGFLRNPRKVANRVYANRIGNGSEASGDGWAYRGGGPIGLTFRGNYRECGAAIGFDLETHPELIERPDVGALAAAWYWHDAGLNNWADRGDFDAVCDCINLGHRTAKQGDSNNFGDRLALWESAKVALRGA